MREPRGPTLVRACLGRLRTDVGIAAVAILLSQASPARAQVFRLEAGSSSLYRADGGSIYVKAKQFEGWFGIGALDPVRIGGAIRTRVRNADVTVGDNVGSLRLPTDFFDPGHSLYTRGVSIGVDRGATRARVVGGTTSTLYSAPYFSAARSDDAIGMLELERVVAPALTVSLRNLIVRKQTHLLGLDWNPPGLVHAAVTVGTGSGDTYAAAGFALDRRWVSVKAAYVHAGDGFHRVLTARTVGSECDRDNILVTVRPFRGVALVAGRNHYIQPSSPGRPLVRGAVDQFLASGTVSGTTISGAYFTSKSPGGGGTGASATIGRDLLSGFRLEGSAHRSDPRNGAPMTSFLGTLRERLSSRIQAVQVATHSAGRTTVSYGGSFTSNPVTVGLEYQTIYLPFAEQASFAQAVMLTVRLQPGGDLQANLASYVGPDGKVRYTAYGNQYLYRGESTAPPRVSLSRDVVRGRVIDEAGNPFPGAALRIGRDVVFTDSRGTFFVRLPKTGDYPLEMAFDQFLTRGYFEVVEAPGSVRAVDEDLATDVVVKIRSVRLQTHVSRPPIPWSEMIQSFAPPEQVDSPTRAARLPNVVHFGLNSTDLGAQTKAILDSLATTLRTTPGMRIRLAGHCDRRGGEAYNLELSRLRAMAVRAYLIRAGVEADRVEAGYYGKTLARSDATDPTALARGRCVTFWYYPPEGVKVVVDPVERDLQIETGAP